MSVDIEHVSPPPSGNRRRPLVGQALIFIAVMAFIVNQSFITLVIVGIIAAVIHVVRRHRATGGA